MHCFVIYCVNKVFGKKKCNPNRTNIVYATEMSTAFFFTNVLICIVNLISN